MSLDRTGSGPEKKVWRRVATTESKAAEPSNGLIRLNKRMAELGLCSRREADEWIDKGWVMVNGNAAGIGLQVKATDRIEIARRASEAQSKLVTIVYHKPMGIVSGQAEDGHINAVEMIQGANRWREDKSKNQFQRFHLKHLVASGRLDIDSTGLLVLTQDGRVAKTLIGENSNIEKEYLVRVSYTGKENLYAAHDPRSTHDKLRPSSDQSYEGGKSAKALFPEPMLKRLRHGLMLDGKALLPGRIDWINEDQLRFILKEGKKRQIRRMCELVGLKVIGLKRVRVGKVVLGDLPVGQWRYLGDVEQF